MENGSEIDLTVTIPPTEEVCKAPEISSEATELNDATERVLKAAAELEGKSASKVFYSNCWEAAYYVYTFASVSNKCVYSDSVDTTYTYSGTAIKIDGTTYQVASSPETQCSLNKEVSADITEDQKLENIKPGYLLSIVYNSNAGHNVIFIEWVDEENRKAKVFDWNGVDANGNKIFRYYETYLSDNQHAVYMYWEPVVA